MKHSIVASRNQEHSDVDMEPLVEIEESESEELESVTSSSESESLDDLEVEAEKSGHIGLLARQAEAIRGELQGQESEEDEESDEDNDNNLGWKVNKDEFYGTNETNKEADNREDIEESLRLQKAYLETLDEADFDLPQAGILGKSDLNMLSEAVSNSLDGKKDDKELHQLYIALKESLDEVNNKISPLLEEAKEDNLCTNQGLAYLEVKHFLLLHYCMCILFYILLKLEGASIGGHPVVLRLVEIRTFLEKIKPMEIRLKPQVDKLLRALAYNKENMQEDDLDGEVEMAPRPDELIPKDNGKESDIYRPPKMNPVAMENDDYKGRNKISAKKKNSARNDSMVGEIVREITGAPEEVPSGCPVSKMKSMLAVREAEDQMHTEEDSYSHHGTTKQSKKLRDQEKSEKYGGVTFDEFAEDIEMTVNTINSSTYPRSLPIHSEKRLNTSGDADLPVGATKLEKLEKSQQQYLEADDESIETEEKTPKKKKSKKETKEVTMSKPPRPPATTKGKRAVSHEIFKNRGLTPHRTRENKNPRKRHRRQFEIKEKKRKGQMQKTHSQAPDHYGGEGSGISSHIRKSVRFS